MRMWRWSPLIVCAALLAGALVQAAEKAVPAPASAEARMRRDTTFLASDECEGRGVGTGGLNKAAEYIAEQFKKAGLKPGGSDGSYFQPFTIRASVLDEPAQLALNGPQ